MDNLTPKCLLTCEVLWDCFPDKQLLGGATLNVGYHLNQLGTKPILLSSVGDDDLGKTAIYQIEKEWGCSAQFIQKLKNVSTGIVEVNLDKNGDASYQLKTPAAWDFIDISNEATKQDPEAFVYSSVALRSDYNKKTFSEFLNFYNGLKCFDINLRLPYNSVDTVFEYAKHADFIKMNEEELKILGAYSNCQEKDIVATIQKFSNLLNVSMVCVTRSSKPAILLFNENLYYGDVPRVKVKDTVGAGDAFFAAMIDSLLQCDFEPQKALVRASKLGSWVATKSGAQPIYDNTAFL